MSVATYKTTRCTLPEDSNLYQHHLTNLKSRNNITIIIIIIITTTTINFLASQLFNWFSKEYGQTLLIHCSA
jgi:hypothetical protein